MELRKVYTDMPDIACVVAANLLEGLRYVLRGARGKIEAILGVKQRAGFAVDRLVREKQPRSKRWGMGVPKPGLCQTYNGFLEH